MKEYKIYTNEQLATKELTETDLYYLFDTPSLNYSLVINMFKFTNKKMKNEEILELCKTNERWVYEYHWTKEERAEYKNMLINIFKNIYTYGPYEAENSADMWLFQYGMSIEGENLLTE